jgi:hypothetical protein
LKHAEDLHEAWTVVTDAATALLVEEVAPRVSQMAQSMGCRSGKAFDLLTGYNLLDSQVRNAVREDLNKSRPDLLIISPPLSHLIHQRLRHVSTLHVSIAGGL